MHLVTPTYGTLSKMCISPINLDSGDVVACRSCKLCKANRVKDYVGRCIAEQSTSDGTLAVTLTYAGDGPNTATLIYSDVQKFLKKLRKDGYKVRYIVAGEYGSNKGRAHWHIVLFFKGKVPDVEIEKTQYTFKYWDHGYSYFQKPDYKGFYYLMKYALKDQTNKQKVRTGHLSMSKKPPLGQAYFLRLAEKHVTQGLTPQDPFYSFPHIVDRDGKLQKFMLRGRSRDTFLQHFKTQYYKKYKMYPSESTFFNEWEDKTVREEVNLEDTFKSLKEEISLRKRAGLSYEPTIINCPNGCYLTVDRKEVSFTYCHGTHIKIEQQKEVEYPLWHTEKLDVQILSDLNLALSGRLENLIRGSKLP